MTFTNLLIENQGHTRIITINRPDQLNALNTETIAQLSQALDAAATDNSVRVLIITGAGPKAFVAGADIKEFAHFTPAQGRQLSEKGQITLFDKTERMPKPVIAAINGFALGGGLELAMSAHIRVASDNARMGLPEVSLGVIPGYGGTQRLTQLAGKGKAMEMIATAGMITASDALACGLVNHVTTPEDLMTKCMEIASKIANNSPRAIGAAYRAVLAGCEDGINGFQAEIDEFAKCFGSEDFKEGTTAFLEKRKPAFTGK